MFLEGRVFKKGVGGGALKKYLPGEGALIQGGRLFKKISSRRGAYSRGALIQGGRLFKEIR